MLPIWDLDGTLVDSSVDLCASGNHDPKNHGPRGLVGACGQSASATASPTDPTYVAIAPTLIGRGRFSPNITTNNARKKTSF